MCGNIVTYVTCPELTLFCTMCCLPKVLLNIALKLKKKASYMHYIIAEFNISELLCELVALVDGNVFLQINMRLLKSV